MSTPPAPAAPAVELRAISKRFGAVHANKAVDLSVAAGTVHGLIGENGAGKSTLMSILYGFYEADAGDILVDGRPARIRSSADAIRLGVGMVHQHFMLVDDLTVLENVMLGAEGAAWLGRAAREARASLKRFERDYGLALDPDARVGDLSVGLQQRVEIVKALHRGARVLVLDEPTAVLTPAEAEGLFRLLRGFAAEGRTVLLVTHKLKEIMAVTDNVSVMRRGEMVATRATAGTSPAELAELMVGRRVQLRVDKGAAPPPPPGPPALAVEALTVRDARDSARVDGVSFELRGGEILGIAGVSGNGQSEILDALAGLHRPTAGLVRLFGEDVTGLDPASLRARGLMHVPEDRLKRGLVAPFEARESAALGFQREARFGAGPFLDPAALERDCAEKMSAYDVRPPSPRLKTANFSGGNQQKIVLAREIERSPRVLLVGQPTRGVDIGAIEFIHKRLVALRDAGVAVLVVSVELDEIVALADRILVVCGGRITGERRPEDTDERDLGLLMAGVDARAA